MGDGEYGRYSVYNIKNWCTGGVDGDIPGNGGPQCAGFMSIHRRLCETLLCTAIPAIYVYWGYSFITYPSHYKFVRKDRGGKRLLLVLVSMVFGIEIGFKFATKQLIYLLNPCHVTTAIQIYLLAAPPSRLVTTVFRIHLNFLNGAVLAIIFPVTNSRLLPFEVEIYWIQHIMMLVTPYYLLRLGGVYTVEAINDMSWTVMSLGILFLYHFLPLQFIGVMAEVNLNNMLCPAISDPFYGPNYRLAAFIHQSLCVPLISKTFCIIANFFITKFPPTKVKETLEADVTMSWYDQCIAGQNGISNHNSNSIHNSNSLHQNTSIHRRTRSEAPPLHCTTLQDIDSPQCSPQCSPQLPLTPLSSPNSPPSDKASAFPMPSPDSPTNSFPPNSTTNSHTSSFPTNSIPNSSTNSHTPSASTLASPRWNGHHHQE